MLSSFTDLDDSCESEVVIREDEWEQEEDCIYKEEWLPIQDDLPQAQPMSFDGLLPPVWTKVLMKKKRTDNKYSNANVMTIAI